MDSSTGATVLFVGEGADETVDRVVADASDVHAEYATDSHTARDRLTDAPVDALVVEHPLPGDDTIELIAETRTRDPHCALFLCATEGNERLASTAIEHGVTAYLPYGFDALDESFEARLRDAIETAGEDRAAGRNRARLQALLENTPDVIVTVDATGTVRDVNEAVEPMLGHHPDTLVDGPLTAIIPPDLVDPHTAAFTAYVETGERRLDWQDLQLEAQHADGSTLPVSVSFAEFHVDDERFFTGIIRDVSDRVRTERELEERERRFRQLAENIQEVVWMTSPDKTEMVYINPAYEDVWGRPCAELYDDPFSFLDTVHPDDRDRVREAIHQQAVDDYDTEYRIVRPDGEVRWIHDRAANITDEDGTVTRIVGVATDITERVYARRELERQNDRLEEFASAVSHDLRNPISIARGSLELVRDDVDHDRLDTAIDALDSMTALITDLLTLARHGELAGDLADVDLPALAREVWASIATPEATLEVADDAPRTVHGDERAIRQLVVNLLQNAIDHGGPDVTVTLGGLENGFYVADDGPGIPPDRVDEVFDAGFTTNDDGTGFGLSIVNRIAEAHGWTVTVSNGRDDGSRFEFASVSPASRTTEDGRRAVGSEESTVED